MFVFVCCLCDKRLTSWLTVFFIKSILQNFHRDKFCRWWVWRFMHFGQNFSSHDKPFTLCKILVMREKLLTEIPLKCLNNITLHHGKCLWHLRFNDTFMVIWTGSWLHTYPDSFCPFPSFLLDSDTTFQLETGKYGLYRPSIWIFNGSRKPNAPNCSCSSVASLGSNRKVKLKFGSNVT